VAQPGDDTCLMPKVGPYDDFAIEWGYRPVDGDTDAEKAGLNAFVAEMQENPIYRFSSPNGQDPTAQTEAIGDDAMRASTYGIENLKRIVANLPEWSAVEGDDYDQLAELFGNVAQQWSRYNGHVLTNVGGVVQTRKRQGQAGGIFEPVPAEAQSRAVAYLNEQVFATPTWMFNDDILSRISGSGIVERIGALQVSALNRLLAVDRMNRLVEQGEMAGSGAYSLLAMLDELRAGLWSEARSAAATDAFRRNLQRAWIARVTELMEDDEALASDAAPALRGQLVALDTELARALPRVTDRSTRLHFEDVRMRIAEILSTDD
jgi:hypothetical protein